jgi:hypothetical protein
MDMWKQHIIGMKTWLRLLCQADTKCPTKISASSLNIKERIAFCGAMVDDCFSVCNRNQERLENQLEMLERNFKQLPWKQVMS